MFFCRPDGGKDCVPVLHFIAERGNVTVFEWRTGKRPTSVESVEPDYGVSDDEDDDESKKALDNGEVSAACEFH